MAKRNFIVLSFILICCFLSKAQFASTDTVIIQSQDGTLHEQSTDETSTIDTFIEQQIRSMPLEQLAAQTIIVRINNVYTPKYAAEIATMQARTGYGGVCFFKGTTQDMLPLAQVLRDNSNIPLWITIDGEWGPAMRLTDVQKFPMQQTLGAISNNNLIYKMGVLVGWQCRALGITWNFLPDADINSEPGNPVIGMRSFGENTLNVTEKCRAYNAGVMSQNVMTSAKHFPGHGNTNADSHYDLPLVSDNIETIDTVYLTPFKALIKDNVSSVMIAHLNIPALDTSKTPSSLSYPIITELLKEKLNFKGLVVTDGLEMRGVLKSDSLVAASRFKNWHNTTGDIEVRALLAGADVLLLPENPETSIKQIVKAVRKGQLPRTRLEDAVRKILRSKNSIEFTGAYSQCVLPADSALMLTNTDAVTQINRLLFANAITLLKNKNNIIPLAPLADTGGIRTITLNTGDTLLDLPFANGINDTASSNNDPLLCKQGVVNPLIVNIINTDILARKNYGILPQTVTAVSQLSTIPAKKILCLFASPYALSFFDTAALNRYDAILVGYQHTEEAMQAAAQIINGTRPAKGHLPVSVLASDGITKIFNEGDGLSTLDNQLYQSMPEEAGWDSEQMKRIDSIALEGIRQKAYPGCQILVAKGNAIIYNKCFGYFTYDSTHTVANTDIYDLASLSKIFGTTLSYMKLYEQHEFKLDEPISKVIHRLYRSPKKKITFRELFAHQSGLKATLKWVTDSVYQNHKIFSYNYDEDDYPYQVADSVYLYKKYRTYIRRLIDESPLSSKPKYIYSDLGFYYLNEAFEDITEKNLDEFATDSFYKPLGLKHFGYFPLQWASRSNIAPTENDTLYRKQVIQGYVHDPLIAFIGGVGGSAGLFGNAADVAVLCRMLLQGGIYADKQYLKSETIDLFTSSNFSSEWNHRAGGFNKPPLKKGDPSACCEYSSAASYGHSGFTGTYFWVDPANDLIYVFLSNRIYPNTKPNKLADLGIRTDIQKLLYEFDNASTNASGSTH
ncbi:MAG: serine hydrolase [Bacteroidales bacterium]|jgi:beta-glucosidase-like glycosyl hydrolase/CubicO group peptidase (beta-lactamase class C family)|nr:serine hydrolase [Bacteroidales bacterium]